MQDNLSELSRRYREEMLRMYGRKAPNPPAVTLPEPEVSAITPENAEYTPDSSVMPLPEPMPEMQVQPPAEPEDDPEFTGYTGDFQDMLPPQDIFEEPVLPDYIRNGTPPVMEQDAADEMADLTDTGLLRIRTLTGDSAFPVAGAHVTVTVRRNGREHLAYLMITDESGETPTVSMPAPPASLSQQPGNVQPFTVVDIRVFANGYFRAQMLNVPVFAGVTSLQTFQLIPLPLIMHENQETLSTDTEFPDL